MGYGILDIGGQTRKQAMAGMDDAAKLENQREAANKQLDAAQKQQTMSAVGTGAGIGFMVGGPVGAGVGAGVGYIASLF